MENLMIEQRQNTVTLSSAEKFKKANKTRGINEAVKQQ